MLIIGITLVHVVVCLILILVVLLQSGKGADLAGAFGGAATQTAFGSRGPASFLSKMTTLAAVLFMATSLSLSLMGDASPERSVLDETKATETKAPDVVPPAAVPTTEEIRKLQEEIEAKQKAAPAGETKPAEEGSKSGGSKNP